MATVEVLTAGCDPSSLIGERLQGLNIGSKVDMQKAHPSQDGNSSDSSGEALKIEGKGNTNPDVECTSNGYARSNGYYGGAYNPPSGGWEDYNNCVGFDTRGYPGVHGEDGSVVYYASGYGYPHQHSYGSHPPGAFMHNGGAGGQGYGPQTFQFPGHIYQHPGPPGVQYYSSPFVSGQEGSLLGPGKPGNGCSPNRVVPFRNNAARGRKNGYQRGPHLRGGSMAAAVSLHGQDAPIDHDKTRGGMASSNSPTNSAREQSHDTTREVPQSIPQTMRPSNDLLVSMECLQPLENQDSPAPGSSAPAAYGAHLKQPSGLPRPGFSSNNGVRGSHGGVGFKSAKVGFSGINWRATERVKQQGRVNGHVAVGNGTSNVWSDQWRRVKPMKFNGHQLTWQVSQNVHHEETEFESEPVNREQYNKESFQTKYDDAKFFIIKSYSEDDVHKSIKYNVWSSTPNGNKKLDGTYQEAQEKAGSEQMNCPVFLFFSVNSSGQFCGVAEMVGPVDFSKNMDFWLQGKWTGCFTVKWHIVKDVPNSQFRHIILSNNDNKPVTHSRDTQEVSIHQGNEMLKIFKDFPLKTSLLDDFSFYDGRQKVLQERKLRQRAHQQAVKGADQGASDNKTFNSNASETFRDEDKENGKPDEMQIVDSKFSAISVDDGMPDKKPGFELISKGIVERNEDKLEAILDNHSNSETDSGQFSEGKDDLPARSINYKKALMVGVEGKRTVADKAVTV